MIDPYSKASRELQQNVEAIEQSLNDWKAVRTSNSSAADYTRQAILSDVASAAPLLKALEDSIRYIAGNRLRFQNISDSELDARSAFVADVGSRIQSVRTQLDEVARASPTVRVGRNAREELLRRAAEDGNQRFIDSELEQQRKMMNEQERLIDSAGDASGLVVQIAKGINDSLIESTGRLADTADRMDIAKLGIDGVVQKVTNFLKTESTWLWAGCIVLTIIAVVLLIWVFLGK
jgi:hypothetical protein